MAKEDGLEEVMIPTKCPDRVVKKGNSKAAMLTGRTYVGLKKLINGNMVYLAFDKYNRKYGKMKKALNKAKSLDLSRASDDVVYEAARELTFGIKHLTTVYDAAQSFGYPFD